VDSLRIRLVGNEWVKEWTLHSTTWHKTGPLVKVFRWINGYLATKDNHDSWRMCRTSTECRTVMTSMFTIMSGMDPHTIRETWVSMVGLLGVS
jgi:hypothetical protein